MPDGKSAFKVYFVSIVGRDEPARYEWCPCAMTPAQVEKAVRDSGAEGVGFVIAFPHITKFFRFAPSMETVLHVRAFQTQGLTPLDLRRDDNYLEFACYAEAAIAADEYHFWAKAPTVAQYLGTFSSFDDGPIASHAKLAAYYAG